MTTITPAQTLGQIVSADSRTAGILERFGLDFCCNGDQTLAAACAKAQLKPAEVIAALTDEAAAAPGQRLNFDRWSLDFLMDFIVNQHHGYLREALPRIQAHCRKIATVHGEHHPELREVAEVFDFVKGEMDSHMMKEEQVLFPYIKGLVAQQRDGADEPHACFPTVAAPIGVMEHEHQVVGEALHRLRALTAGFAVPADGCTTYAMTMQELAEFESDTHLHIHKENSILHPQALALERELQGSAAPVAAAAPARPACCAGHR